LRYLKGVGVDDDADRERKNSGRDRTFIRRVSSNGYGELDVESQENHLGNLRLFAGVLEFPARVKCASLSWHTLNAALHGEDTVTTE
jgi:hypothetical protein